MNAILTDHARLRLTERTALSEQDFLKILNHNETASVGYEPKTFRWHRLFYSRPDDTHFVAIQDIANGEVVTILPLDYHENLAWKISEKKLKQAVRRVDPQRHIELYNSPALPGHKFTITGLFWDEQMQTRRRHLGSYFFSSFPNSVEEIAADDALIGAILSKLRSRSLESLTLDELLLHQSHTGTLFKISWEQIAEFSLRSDDRPCGVAGAGD